MARQYSGQRQSNYPTDGRRCKETGCSNVRCEVSVERAFSATLECPLHGLSRGHMPAKKKSSSTRGKGKVKKVMHEYKHGQLKSGGSGAKVKSRKQAVAIALSEARESG